MKTAQRIAATKRKALCLPRARPIAAGPRASHVSTPRQAGTRRSSDPARHRAANNRSAFVSANPERRWGRARRYERADGGPARRPATASSNRQTHADAAPSSAPDRGFKTPGGAHSPAPGGRRPPRPLGPALPRRPAPSLPPGLAQPAPPRGTSWLPAPLPEEARARPAPSAVPSSWAGSAGPHRGPHPRPPDPPAANLSRGGPEAR